MSDTRIIFTLCSNNYLAQALVLSKSVRDYQPDWNFIIGLVDKKNESVEYENFPCEVLEVAVVEPNIKSLAEKYSIVELNTCVKPAYFNYFFNTLFAEQVIYLDPDICLYSRMTELIAHLSINDIILTPHILTPIPLDGCTPRENLFLNYGIYNLGFIAVKKSETTKQFLKWWMDRTYAYGYNKPASGLFTDQLWINLVPIYFEHVGILKHPGYNMAPWNLHERRLVLQGENYFVNGDLPLVFFHFSGFDPRKEKLHKDYTRFEMNQRPDLVKLFGEYKVKMEAHLEKYKDLACYYSNIRNAFLISEESIMKQHEANLYADLPFYKKIIRQAKRHIPAGLKNSVLKLIKI